MCVGVCVGVLDLYVVHCACISERIVSLCLDVCVLCTSEYISLCNAFGMHVLVSAFIT